MTAPLTERGILISPDEILLLSEKVGENKFLKRHHVFTKWISGFIEVAKSKEVFPRNARLLNGQTPKEMGLYLNYFYWRLIEEFVRPNLKLLPEGSIKVNHYKIAAATEYIVMKYLPFEDDIGNPITTLNADFAFHIALQILFSWNINKDKIEVSVIRDLIINNEPTEKFITEHKTWLNCGHVTASQYIIFSNMQTMRLFHYWFRSPKDGDFKNY